MTCPCRSLLLAFAAVTANAAFPGASSAQSIVVNGDFDEVDQLDGWIIDESPQLSVEWLADDADDDPSSGSILIGNHSANANNGVVVEQCLRVQPGGEYRFGGRAKLPTGPGQSLTGRGPVAVRWASDTACTTFVTGSVGTGGTFASFDTWVQRSATRVAPDDAHSVLLRALVTKDEAGGSLFVQFDDLYLLPPDGMFGNGFESTPE